MTAPTTWRTALVTGASRGIGHGIACELASRGYGLTVLSRSSRSLKALEDEFRAKGAAEVTTVVGDLANRADVAKVVQVHDGVFGSMNVLALSGGVGTAAPVDALTQRRIDKTVEVNFGSALTLVRDSLPLLRKAAGDDPQRGTRVIALSSITGVFAEPGLAVYGASKAALTSFMETLNAEESGRGVMATAICPGYVNTEMSAWTTDVIPASTMIPVEDVVRVVAMLLDLGSTTSITQMVLTRSGTLGYFA